MRGVFGQIRFVEGFRRSREMSYKEKMRMKRYSLILKLVALTIFVLAITSVAEAQATRTWVSGVGDDVNPCSRTAPCKTFAGAISKTARNGEINCLDPAGYGAVTITKSITIDCEDTQGSILASLVNGVVINITDAADTHKTVRLRGISINGAGNGLDGIRIISALSVHLEELVIDGFTGDGIEVAQGVANQTTELNVWNSSIRNMHNAGGNGALLQTNQVGGLVASNWNSCYIANINGDGIDVGNNGRAQISDSAIALATGSSVRVSGTGEANIDGSQLNMSSNGLRVEGGVGRVSNCQIAGNAVGLQQTGGVLETWQNNLNRGNGANTAGTVTPINQN